MSEQEKQQRIEDYLNDQLPVAERKALENRLATDANLQAAVNLQREIAETLGDKKLKQLTEIMQQTDADWHTKSSTPQTKTIRIKWWKKAVAIAALLLLSLTVWQVFFTTTVSSKDLFTTHFAPYDMVLTQRSDTNLNPKLLQTAIDNYTAKNYERAANQFATIAQQQPEQPLYRLYGCVAQLATTATPATTNCFMDLQQYPKLLQQATWYLGLSYLQQGEIKEARTTFQKIKNGQFKFAEANYILRHLSE